MFFLTERKLFGDSPPPTRVGLRPSALGRGKDSPSSGTLLSPSGLKVPESLIECRVTSRVQSELLELASRKVGAFAPGPGAALLEGRAVTWNCVPATPKPAGYAGGWRRVPGTAPAHVLGPSQPQSPCVSGPWIGEEGRLQHQADPFGSGASRTVLSPGCGPAIGPAGPTSLCFQLWAGAGVVLGGKQYRLYLGS